MKHIISAGLVLAGIMCIEHKPIVSIVCIVIALVASHVNTKRSKT